jgi:hypothetical protein
MYGMLLLVPLLSAGPAPVPITPQNVGAAVTAGQIVSIEGEFVALIEDDSRHRWMIQIRSVGVRPADKFNPARKEPFDVWVELADFGEETVLLDRLKEYIKARETYRHNKPKPSTSPPVVPKLKFLADGKPLMGRVYGGARQAS